MTYDLAKVKVDPHAKNHGQRSNGSNRRRTDGHTDATKLIIAPATRSINVRQACVKNVEPKTFENVTKTFIKSHVGLVKSLCIHRMWVTKRDGTKRKVISRGVFKHPQNFGKKLTHKNRSIIHSFIHSVHKEP